jgi:hypothetical protein
MVCAEHMRIINNSVAKVKALAKAEGVVGGEREIVVEQQPQQPPQQEQLFHQQPQQQGDRIYQVTDGLKSKYTERLRLCLRPISERWRKDN